MTVELTPAYDGDAGQVIMEGLPTGAAGEAGLVPAGGVELVFDRADGCLARVVIDTGKPGGPAVAGEAAALLMKLFGQDAPDEVRRAARKQSARRALSPEPGLSAVLSRLARLDTARSTSPVPPASPLWAAEAAALADQAGLHNLARAQARQAAAGLARLLSCTPVPDALSRAALAVADLADADEPEAARQLRESVRSPRAGSAGQWLTGSAEVTRLAGRLQRRRHGAAGRRFPGLQWSLDPGFVPEGVFLLGLTPCSDLLVHLGDRQDRLVVEALLTPGADRGALSRCRARLVDPPARCVLAQGSFTRAGPRARAELQLPCPIGKVEAPWIEVVDDQHRPVRSERSRRLRRALRWADAALRAEQHPQGLAPRLIGEDWTALAATAWRHCQYNWENTGDADRAYLASIRLAALDPQTRPPAAPSAWTTQIAGRSPLEEPAFLAEKLGG